MRYLSVCSGIEAATVAWHDLGWQPVGFSEIEPFPSQVLAHHYPDVQNYGDMTNFKEWNCGETNLLVGGTPCQSFSVAGLRAGLDDPRGNLALVYCSMLDYFRPTWFVWENVPGVLSSNKGRDFGSFLGAVAKLRYGFAYRVLDAQYFGVAQRRRRVFVVGYAGDWRPAAAVLFECQSLCRDSKPSRETGQETARHAAKSAGISCESVAHCLQTSCHDYSPADGFNMVAQSIALAENTIGRQAENGGNGLGCTVNGPMYTLNTTGVHGVAQVYENHPTDSRIKPLDKTCSTVTARWGTGGGNTPIVAQPIGGIDYENNAHLMSDPTGPLLKGSPTGGGRPLPALVYKHAVRRLTPIECERLQGFPDNYTQIEWRNKPADQCPDGHRYKALGNSMAVPVMRWIGQRIDAVSKLGVSHD